MKLCNFFFLVKEFIRKEPATNSLLEWLENVQFSWRFRSDYENDSHDQLQSDEIQENE